MKLTRKSGLLAVVLMTAGSLAAIAAGNYSTYPIIGGASFCAATVSGAVPGGVTGQGQSTSGSICAQTVPAGPSSLTGVELIPADSQLTGSGPPQSVVIPSAMLGSLNSKVNRLIGGDFNTNLWQRGTTPVSAATPSTTVMGADRWAVFSSGNTVTVTKQTGASDSIPTLGLYASMRVNRPSGVNVTDICTGQVLDKQAAAELLGNNGVLSFYGLAGAGFSAANSNLKVTVAYYTAADSATPGTNTDTFMKGTTTGFQAIVGGVSNGTTGSVASGVATIPISTTWTRYAVWATIPTANASGTAVTGVGVTICYTPVGTGGATDWFEVEGVQLQVMPSTVTANLANGVTSPTGFERRAPAVEASLQYYYSFVLLEPISPNAQAIGSVTASTNCKISYPLPSVMRTAPTFSTSGITSPNNFEIRDVNTTFAVSAIATSGNNTVNQLSLNVTSVGLTTGHACALEGNQGGALGIATAEP